MISSTLIGWYRGCADKTRFDTVSPLLGSGGFCTRVASWKGLGWGLAEDTRYGGAFPSESNEGFDPKRRMKEKKSSILFRLNYRELKKELGLH